MNQPPNHLWQSYRDQLYYFILKRVGDAPTAEDIVQEVMLKVLTNVNTLKEKDKLRPWLYQISRNAIIDYYRQKRDTAALPDTLATELRDEQDNDTLQELANCCIRPFVQQLPEPYQEAVQLAELRGYSHKEVAHQQAISLSAAKSRVRRGRQLLKGLFLQCCQFEFDQRGAVTDFHTANQCGNC